MTTPTGRDVLLLDGATGSELDRRCVDVSLPLWSARALISEPQAIAEIHREYLRAGAEAITANTFRTHARTLARESGVPGAAELSRRAVQIARAARDEHAPGALVLGSVAPLEDCYRPDLAPDADACRREHAELIGPLVDAGVVQAPMIVTATKKSAALPPVITRLAILIDSWPTASGTIMASATNAAISSMTAEVIILVATTECCRPSPRNDTIVNDTAVAVIASAHINEISGSFQIASVMT